MLGLMNLPFRQPERPALNRIYCKGLVDKTIFLAKYNILILHEIVINTINIDFLRDAYLMPLVEMIANAVFQ